MERQRQHEAQHAQVSDSSSDTDQGKLTAGNKAEEEEEEKEIDPSIVGSLDDVYKDDPNDPNERMKDEDPFKKVPMIGDHEKPTMEMEKSYDAMVALVGEASPGSPLPEDATSLDRELRKSTGESANGGGSFATDPQALPDLVGAVDHHHDPTVPLSPSQPYSSPSSSSSSSSPSGLPLDVAVGAQRSVDLLDEATTGSLPNSRPVDLTQGLQPSAKS